MAHPTIYAQPPKEADNNSLLKKLPEYWLWQNVLVRAFLDLEHHKYNTVFQQDEWNRIQEDAIRWFRNKELGLIDICNVLRRDVTVAQAAAEVLYDEDFSEFFGGNRRIDPSDTWIFDAKLNFEWKEWYREQTTPLMNGRRNDE